MKMIGITGGVGSGKSQVLSWLKENCQGQFLEADKIAHRLMLRGGPCYPAVCQLFGETVVGGDGELDRGKMAEQVFRKPELRERLNAIVHPAVKTYIRQAAEQAKAQGEKFLFLEAALLIEEKYDEICDELWYVYAEEKVRRERLKASRRYSDQKIDGIIGSQLPEQQFRSHCCFVLDNSGDFRETIQQLEQRMKIYENV